MRLGRLVLLLFIIMMFGYGCMPVKVDLKFNGKFKTNHGDVAVNIKLDVDSDGNEIEGTGKASFTISVGEKNYRCVDIGVEYIEKELNIEADCNLET